MLNATDTVRSSGYHPLVITFIISSATLLSVLSSLDCQFVSISIGFPPLNSPFLGSSNFTTIGAGFWLFESPERENECVIPSSAVNSGIVENQDYKLFLWNDDTKWSTARIMAILGVLFGLLASVLMWFNVIMDASSNRGIVICCILISLICEVGKLGLFFQIHLCTEDAFLLNSTDDIYEKAASCDLARGSYASLVCIFLYLIASCTLLLFMVRSKPLETFDFGYDYLPSMLRGNDRPPRPHVQMVQMVPMDKRSGRRSSVTDGSVSTKSTAASGHSTRSSDSRRPSVGQHGADTRRSIRPSHARQDAQLHVDQSSRRNSRN